MIEPSVFKSFAEEVTKKLKKDELRVGDAPESTGTKKVLPANRPLYAGRTGPKNNEYRNSIDTY